MISDHWVSLCFLVCHNNFPWQDTKTSALLDQITLEALSTGILVRGQLY